MKRTFDFPGAELPHSEAAPAVDPRWPDSLVFVCPGGRGPRAVVNPSETCARSLILPARRVNHAVVLRHAVRRQEGRSTGSGAAAGASGGGRPAVDFPHRHEADGTMTAAMAMPGNTADTFVVHFFGTGLADDCYVVERYRARADGDIVPAPPRRSRRRVGARRSAPQPR